MADPLTSFGIFISSGLGEIGKILLGIIILAVVIWVLIRAFGSPKPINMGKVVFQKNWDATTTLGFSNSKKMCICPMAQDIEDIKKLPEYQIHHLPVGNIVGVNIYPVIHSIPLLMSFAKKADKESYTQVIEENKKLIEEDKLWIMFALKSQRGSLLFGLFPIMKKTLVYVKPNQIISVNSADNNILVKGFGLQAIGEYMLVVDHNTNINMEQFIKDQAKMISREVELSTWDMHAEIVKKSMGLDSGTKKDLIRDAMKIPQQPTNPEAKI